MRCGGGRRRGRGASRAAPTPYTRCDGGGFARANTEDREDGGRHCAVSPSVGEGANAAARWAGSRRRCTTSWSRGGRGLQGRISQVRRGRGIGRRGGGDFGFARFSARRARYTESRGRGGTVKPWWTPTVPTYRLVETSLAQIDLPNN
jgi:hypothetical protein